MVDPRYDELILGECEMWWLCVVMKCIVHGLQGTCWQLFARVQYKQIKSVIFMALLAAFSILCRLGSLLTFCWKIFWLYPCYSSQSCWPLNALFLTCPSICLPGRDIFQLTSIDFSVSVSWTAGLAESIGSLQLGLWLMSLGWLSVTGISSGILCSVIEYGLPFLLHLWILCYVLSKLWPCAQHILSLSLIIITINTAYTDLTVFAESHEQLMARKTYSSLSTFKTATNTEKF